MLYDGVRHCPVVYGGVRWCMMVEGVYNDVSK